MFRYLQGDGSVCEYLKAELSCFQNCLVCKILLHKIRLCGKASLLWYENYPIFNIKFLRRTRARCRIWLGTKKQLPIMKSIFVNVSRYGFNVNICLFHGCNLWTFLTLVSHIYSFGEVGQGGGYDSGQIGCQENKRSQHTFTILRKVYNFSSHVWCAWLHSFHNFVCLHSSLLAGIGQPRWSDFWLHFTSFSLFHFVELEISWCVERAVCL